MKSSEQQLNDTNVQIRQQIVQKQPAEEQQVQAASFSQLFRFKQTTDVVLMVFGTIGALISGAILPVFILFWGDLTNTFGSSNDVIVQAATNVLVKFIIIAVVAFFSGWMMITFWTLSGQRQATKCRKMYFKRLLEQQIGWFDCQNQSELSVKFTTDNFAFQSGIGEKIATLIQVIGTFIGGFIVAFTKSWLMTLVVLATIPVMALTGLFSMKMLQSKEKKNKEFYDEAGSLSQQAISSIKTVKQLNGEAFEHARYLNSLNNISQKSRKFALLVSLSMGLLSGAMMISYSLGFWFGSHCLQQDSICPSSIAGVTSAGDVLVVFFSILVASINLTQISPALKKIAESKTAAGRIFKILDRQSLIKSPQNGKIPSQFFGKIAFEDVTFAYPKDKSKQILKNLSMQFEITSTALIGQSGCGKSTIVQLIMRFYDPNQGRITLDGYDLRELDLSWLRQQIGYVGQEPVLFATTILKNLQYGNQNASPEDIDEALKQAEAYDFIYNNLEDKLQTFVGGGGNQISGGQKQRIAIARALIKKPKILLLDQATSALDRRNEKLIQNTLNKVSKGLTTITIAHRINTIINSNYIFVLNGGQVEEQGRFGQLKRFKDYKIQQNNQDQKDNGQREMSFEKQQKIQNNKVQNYTLIKQNKEQKLKERRKILLEKHEKNVFSRLFSYNKNHCCLFIFGIIVSCLLGLIYPLFSVFLSQIIRTFFQFTNKSNIAQARTDADIAALVFLLIALGSFILSFIQAFSFSMIGNEITQEVRKQTYQKILKMPVSWFDLPQNNTGNLSSRLALDCQTINGVVTTYVSIMIQSVSTLVIGVIVAFVFEWRTALTALALMPFLIIAGALRAYFRNNQDQKGDQVYKQSANLVMESIVNIRTVVSFGVENSVLNKYSSELNGPYKTMQKAAIVTGSLFGLSQFLTNICFALIFYIGTLFIRDAGVTQQNVFTAIYAIFFSAITVGNTSHFLPDLAEGKIAGASIFQILDAPDEDQIQERQKSKMLKQGFSGDIVFDNVQFKYETRSQQVFKNLNVKITNGKKIAFVGASGCGKSTIMQMLLRFYYPSSGTISINGNKIEDYDIHYLRSQFGVVSQEPTLFQGTYQENIKYNLNVTNQDMKRAALQANALSFIEGNEQLKHQQKTENKGFQKDVGIKGSHISGGQKQRVVIARAILRNPYVLLLDEATSALDHKNQEQVQTALDQIMSKKTTISIAHRIETIKNSDQIIVFDKGHIVQQGTFSTLMQKRGYFYNLEKGTSFL